MFTHRWRESWVIEVQFVSRTVEDVTYSRDSDHDMYVKSAFLSRVKIDGGRTWIVTPLNLWALWRVLSRERLWYALVHFFILLVVEEWDSTGGRAIRCHCGRCTREKVVRDNDSQDSTSVKSTGSASEETRVTGSILGPYVSNASVPSVSFSCNSKTKCDNVGSLNKRSLFSNHKSSTSKSCFVCGSTKHLIKDCDYYEKRLDKGRGSRNNDSKRKTPTDVSADRSNPISADTPISAEFPNSADTGKPICADSYNSAEASIPAGYVIPARRARNGRPTTPYVQPFSHPQRPLHRLPSHNGHFYAYLNYLNSFYGESANTKTYDKAKDRGIVDSGCSRSMSGNRDKLEDFVAMDGGEVTFGGGVGHITGKGTIRTSCLLLVRLWYPRDSPFHLEAFSDSDYAGATGDRKSTTGGCQYLGRRLISWQCKKQTIVATSSCEAEYVAAASCCGQVAFLEKTKRKSDGFHDIIDFINSTPIRYALVTNPIVRESLVRQFWATALEVSLPDATVSIEATIDGHAHTITEASIRSSLRLNDQGATVCLPTDDIYSGLAAIGYVPDQGVWRLCCTLLGVKRFLIRFISGERSLKPYQGVTSTLPTFTY
ncbi:hypothetical protein Tco_0783801 [Tanacetum coccineum]